MTKKKENKKFGLFYLEDGRWRVLEMRKQCTDDHLDLRISFEGNEYLLQVHKNHPKGEKHRIMEKILNYNQSAERPPNLSKSIEIVRNQVLDAELEILEKDHTKRKHCTEENLQKILQIIKKDSQEPLNPLESGMLDISRTDFNRSDGSSQTPRGYSSKLESIKKNPYRDFDSDEDMIPGFKKKNNIFLDSDHKEFLLNSNQNKKSSLDTHHTLQYNNPSDKMNKTIDHANGHLINQDSDDETCCICVCKLLFT